MCDLQDRNKLDNWITPQTLKSIVQLNNKEFNMIGAVKFVELIVRLCASPHK